MVTGETRGSPPEHEIPLHRISTLGHPSVRSTFTYVGSIPAGIALWFKSGEVTVSAAFLRILLRTFAGETVPGGFQVDDAPKHSVGRWIQTNSQRLNSERLTAWHASFIAAALVHEGYAQSQRQGHAVYLSFPAMQSPVEMQLKLPLPARLAWRAGHRDEQSSGGDFTN